MSLRQALKNNKADFLQDLAPYTVIEYREAGYISKEDFNSIMNSDDIIMVNNFYSWLSNLPESELKKFVSFLKDWYYWLHRLFPTPQDPLYIGGVPPLPERHVTRTTLVSELRGKLMSLEKPNFVILYGMIGSGRTTLAVEVLHTESFVSKYFNNSVFWLKAAKEKNDLAQHLQNSLNEMLSDSVQNLSTTLEKASNQLKSKMPNDALLILDDVPCDSGREIIKTFYHCCKMLIITEDESIVPKEYKSRAQMMKVTAAFTRDETQSLLAKCLGVDVSELPKKADELYDVTKGFPMTISHIIGRLEESKESILKDDKHWDYYIEPLHELKISLSKENKWRQSFPGIDEKWRAMRLSINKLSPDMREKYYDLAVFIKDANIKPEVLCVFWSQTTSEVQETMNYFRQKNLIVREWIQKIGSYVYGIHYMFVLFLNLSIQDGEAGNCTIQNLHKKLVAKYEELCGGDFSKLPTNDNYIFHYICHHLKQANQLDKLAALYFNLKFLEAKLRVTGPRDLLSELKLYRKEIQPKELCEKQELLDDLIQLIENHGQQLFLHKNLDIVQLAFAKTESRHILQMASELAKERTDKCYIQFGTCPFVRQQNVLNCKLPLSALCAHPRNPNHILLGHENGQLRLWNFPLQKLIRQIQLHEKQITKIVCSKSDAYILTSSLDGFVFVFSFDDIFPSKSTNISVPDRLSPQQSQDDYLDMWSKEKGGGLNKLYLNHGHPVVSAVFNSSSFVATCSSNKLSVWKLDFNKIGDPLWSHLIVSDAATCCAFSSCDKWVLVGCANSCVLLYNSSDGQSLKSIPFTYPIVDILPFKDEGCLILTKKSLFLWEANNDESTKMKHIFRGNSSGGSYVCFSATLNFICVVPEAPAPMEVYFSNSRQKIDEIKVHSSAPKWVCVSCVEHVGGCWIVILCCDLTVRRWWVESPPVIPPPPPSKRCCSTRNTFKLLWPDDHQAPVFTSVDADCRHKIHVCTNETWSEKIVSEPTSEVKALDISPDGRVIACLVASSSLPCWELKACPLTTHSSFSHNQEVETLMELEKEEQEHSLIVRVFLSACEPFSFNSPQNSHSPISLYTYIVATSSVYKVWRSSNVSSYPASSRSIIFDILYFNRYFTSILSNGAIMVEELHDVRKLMWDGRLDCQVVCCSQQNNILAVVERCLNFSSATITINNSNIRVHSGGDHIANEIAPDDSLGRVFIYYRMKVKKMVPTTASPTTCVFLEDKHLAVGFNDGTLSIFDTTELNKIYELFGQEGVSGICSLARRKDNFLALVAVYWEGNLHTWTTEDVLERMDRKAVWRQGYLPAAITPPIAIVPAPCHSNNHSFALVDRSGELDVFSVGNNISNESNI